MTNPKILPAALALLSTGLLVVASCRQVTPRTVVLGPISCELKHGQRVTRCGACIKSSCCDELLACANDAPCPCGLYGREHMMPSKAVFDLCGPLNAAYAALASCLDKKCADDCPMEDALHKHPLLGKSAPEIVGEPIMGKGPKTIADAKGKVLILDFWATWCGACRRSFPKYQELADRFPGDVVVVAISVDDPERVTADKIRASAKEAGAAFSILWDRRLLMQARYTAPSSLPATFLIDRSGVIRSVHVGFDPGIPAEVEALVKPSAPSVSAPHPQGGTVP